MSDLADTPITGPPAVEYGPVDVTDAAAARGESQLEAMNQFRADCMSAIRSDPELNVEYIRGELMAAYGRENTPPSYDRDEMDQWQRTAPDRSITHRLEADLTAAQAELASSRERWGGSQYERSVDTRRGVER